MSDAIDAALKDLKSVSLFLPDTHWTSIQRAIVGIVPVGMSVACSVRQLVQLGYIPSAKILIRPLIERVMTAEYLFSSSQAVELWLAGWPQKKRPKLAYLLSLFEKGHPEEWRTYQTFMVDDLHSAIHPNPLGDEKFQTPNDQGKFVFWHDTVPNAFEMADNVCAATMMSAVFLASQAKRAFVWKESPAN